MNGEPKELPRFSNYPQGFSGLLKVIHRAVHREPANPEGTQDLEIHSDPFN
jgi:hypothetical protein